MAGIRYHVIVLEKAADDLADLWLTAESEERNRLTAAWHHVEQRLRVDPDLQGLLVAFPPPIFVMQHSGVRILYTVVPDDRHVFVLKVERGEV
jgi:hypothetical protein